MIRTIYARGNLERVGNVSERVMADALYMSFAHAMAM
jgi:hypothetical protein